MHGAAQRVAGIHILTLDYQQDQAVDGTKDLHALVELSTTPQIICVEIDARVGELLYI